MVMAADGPAADGLEADGPAVLLPDRNIHLDDRLNDGVDSFCPKPP